MLRTDGLIVLDRHLVMQMFSLLWAREGWPTRDMTAIHYGRLADAVAANAGATAGATDFPGGFRVSRTSRGQLTIEPGR